MKITILSIGKFDNSPHKDVYDFYLKRLKWKVELRELEVKITKNFEEDKIKNLEAEVILKNLKNFTKILILDEAGKQFSSVELADIFRNCADDNPDIAFVIGGAFGLAAEVKKRANILLSLSKMTFPHLMVRGILLEQIYRSQTIIDNHPYHKK